MIGMIKEGSLREAIADQQNEIVRLRVRVQDLLESNNAYEERARAAEREVKKLKSGPVELAVAIETALRAVGVGEDA
jgi:hypothetical protein